MRVQMAVVLACLTAAPALATEAFQFFSEAEAIWKAKKDDAKYQSYAAEFSQFNNHFRLDEKDGCYALGSEHVNLMLIITHPANAEFAVVERVLSDVDNAKARCFRKSYEGLRTKIPPSLPFVLQMSMR
jgi:hypothetical protein